MTRLNPCSVALWIASASLIAACSSTPPPKSPESAALTPNIAKTEAAPGPARAPVAATTVAIDDAILRACHIDADEAFFAFDSSRLEGTAVRPLSAVATCFTRGPLKGRSIKLVGRADPRGDDEYNMVLGQSRADSVGAVLSQKGLERSRMSSTSRGDLDANGHDENGWSKDRRVDILLGS